MLYPKRLKKGDTIGLVCPSSGITPERVTECINAIESMGFKTKVADNLTMEYAGYMAGDGLTRGQWINKMFGDPQVDGIFCIRGGDGSSRIMKYLDYDLIRANPKVFVGYSDVTNMLLAFPEKCGFVAFHGPMVSSNMVDFDEESRESFFNAIDAVEDYKFKNPEGFDIKVLKEGKGTGRLTGGNLSLLSASIGTEYSLDGSDKIVFIEEVCEPLSKIDKWIFHLRNAGVFDNCKGVILGQFTDVVNEDLPEFDAICSVRDALDGLDIPVMYNIQAGHGEKNMTLPMGAVCTIDTSDQSIKFKVER